MFVPRSSYKTGIRLLFGLSALNTLFYTPAQALSNSNTSLMTGSEINVEPGNSYGAAFDRYIHAMRLNPDLSFLILNSLIPFSQNTRLSELCFEAPLSLRIMFDMNRVNQSQSTKTQTPQESTKTQVSQEPTKAEVVRKINNLGVKLLNASQYKTAVLCFSKALSLDPQYKIARDNLQIAYANQAKSLEDKPNEALRILHRSLFINPSSEATIKSINAALKKMNKDRQKKNDRQEMIANLNADGDFIGAFLELYFARNDSKAVTKEQMLEAYKKISLEDQKLSAGFDLNSPKPVNNYSKSASSTDRSKSQNDVVFGDYMANLSKQIKHNWHPPKMSESQHVDVIFKIDTNGKLSNLSVSKPSGDSEVDKAAIKAVEASSPFAPLPSGAAKDVDISFKFDYNVWTDETVPLFSSGSTRRRRAEEIRSALLNTSEYAPFLDKLEKQIKKAWVEPLGADFKPVVLIFSVNQAGKTSEPEIYESSGIKRTDQAAINAVRNAGLVLPPPGAGPKVNVQFTFGRQLEQIKD